VREYATDFNGMKRGDNITVDGEVGKFIHACLNDGAVEYVMVTFGRQWRAVPGEKVLTGKPKRGVK
jgi:hypothetical protein